MESSQKKDVQFINEVSQTGLDLPVLAKFKPNLIIGFN